MIKLTIRKLLGLLVLGISLGLAGFEPLAFSASLETRTDELMLTPDQLQTLKILTQQFNQEQVQIRRKIMIKRNELRTLTAEEIPTDKGEAIRREIQTLLFQARERSLFYREAAFSILTPEQRKKISAEADLGFHCGGLFRHRGRWGMGPGSGGSEPSK